MVQMQKNELGKAQNATREKQLIIDEQKIMLQEKMAGLDHESTVAKAQAELGKAMIDKDIAVLNHATKLTEIHGKNQQRDKKRG